MIKTIFFGALTVCLAASGVWYALTSNFNFGNLLVWLMAIASLLYALFHKQLDAFTMAGFGFILKVLFGIGCAFFCIILAWILWGQMVNKPSGDEAFVFVLGCAVNGEEPSSVLTYRLDAAYDYYLAHPDVTLVVTGGQGATEVIAEAVVMQRYLIEKGVPAAQILVESESTSTEENFRFSKELLQTNGYTIDDDTPIVYITNGFHCMRAGLYAANEGFTNVSVIAAGMPLMQLLPCYLREVFAVVYYLAFKSPNVGFLKNYIGYLAIFGKR